MITGIAKRITHSWVMNRVILAEEADSYKYGLELLLSGICNTAVMISISIILHCPFAWIIFMLAFAPLRLTAGGFHAESHWGCIGMFCTTYAWLIYVASRIPSNFQCLCELLISCGSLWVIYILSPVEAKNKPLSKAQYTKYRTRSLVIAVFLFVFSLCIWIGILSHKTSYIYLYVGELSSMISLIVGRQSCLQQTV